MNLIETGKKLLVATFQPLVCVLMSVNNGEAYVRDAIVSVLSQTFAEFEFIIIDDGSTDSTFSIISEYHDPRIHLIRNEKKIGLTKSLNKGLAVARGEYIARIDSDDISYSNRLEQQLEVIKSAGADICFCRSDFTNIETGAVRTWKEVSWPLIRWLALFQNSYGFHSAVMFKRKTVMEVGGYDDSVTCAQDYELWDRCAACGLKFTYAPVPLILCRLHPQAISHKHLAEQERCARQISFRAMQRMLPKVKEEELQGVRWLFLQREQAVPKRFIQAGLNRCQELVESFSRNLMTHDCRFIWDNVATSVAARIGDVKAPLRTFAFRLLVRAILHSRSIRTLARAIRVLYAGSGEKI